MKTLVITGTDVKGCTYHMKEIFLQALASTQVKEFTLPSQGPAYCLGCKTCFSQGEDQCPHADKTQPIWEAMLASDLIVFIYPVYVMRAPGHVKSLLDHFGVHWMATDPTLPYSIKRQPLLPKVLVHPMEELKKM